MEMSRATLRGTRKAYQIIANPDPRKNKKYRSQIVFTNPVAVAWMQTGQLLRSAMDATQKRIARYSSERTDNWTGCSSFSPGRRH